MNRKFNNADELNQYLEKLERRIENLENENKQLIKRNQPIKLPQTNIINPNFLSRAFTVWGHFFTAHIIITITIGIIYLCVVVGALGLVSSSIRKTEVTTTPLYVAPPNYLTQIAETPEP